MSKVEDYQIEAVLEKSEVAKKWGPSWVRMILEAALSATPPEPEIVVTEEMFNAGYEAMCNSSGPTSIFGDVRAIYRAMHKASPKPAYRRTTKCNLGWGTTGYDSPNTRSGKDRRVGRTNWNLFGKRMNPNDALDGVLVKDQRMCDRRQGAK